MRFVSEARDSGTQQRECEHLPTVECRASRCICGMRRLALQVTAPAGRHRRPQQPGRNLWSRREPTASPKMWWLRMTGGVWGLTAADDPAPAVSGKIADGPRQLQLLGQSEERAELASCRCADCEQCGRRCTSGVGGTDPTVTVPTQGVSFEDGVKIKTALGSAVTVKMTGSLAERWLAGRTIVRSHASGATSCQNRFDRQRLGLGQQPKVTLRHGRRWKTSSPC